MQKTQEHLAVASVESHRNINFIIDEVVSALIEEAVSHFEGARPRDYSDDSRFFYSEDEINAFWKAYRGDPHSLVCKTILDDVGGFFCYEVCRVRRRYSV